MHWATETCRSFQVHFNIEYIAHLLVICCKYIQNTRYTRLQNDELFVRMAGFGPSQIRNLANKKYALCIFIRCTFNFSDSQSLHLLHKVPLHSITIFSFPFGCVENETCQMIVTKSRKTYLKPRLVNMQMHLLFDSAGYRRFYVWVCVAVR